MTQESKKMYIYLAIALCVVFVLAIAGLFFPRPEVDPTPTPDPTPDVVAELVPEAVAEIARENRAAIDAGLKGENIGEGVLAMERVLEAWDPTGYKSETLTELLGQPTAREEGVLTYRFDSGFGGWDWHFSVDPNDTITSVDRQSME